MPERHAEVVVAVDPGRIGDEADAVDAPGMLHRRAEGTEDRVALDVREPLWKSERQSRGVPEAVLQRVDLNGAR